MTREDDCIVLLEYLHKHGHQSLRKMEAATGIPFSSIREYINPNIPCRKSWEELERIRRTNFRLYEHYLTTIINSDKDGCSINLSKFNYLQKAGLEHGYYVEWLVRPKRIVVTKLDDNVWDFV